MINDIKFIYGKFAITKGLVKRKFSHFTQFIALWSFFLVVKIDSLVIWFNKYFFFYKINFFNPVSFNGFVGKYWKLILN